MYLYKEIKLKFVKQRKKGKEEQRDGEEGPQTLQTHVHLTGGNWGASEERAAELGWFSASWLGSGAPVC